MLWELKLYIALIQYIIQVFIKHNSNLLHQETTYTLYYFAVYTSLHVSV